MIEPLTWSQIKERFPDQWVLLENPEDDGADLLAGTVREHGPQRKPLLEHAHSLNSRFAVVFTGAITRGLFGINVKALDQDD